MKISLAIPTFVEIIGVFVIADSIIDAGPPSKREATIYKSRILYKLFKDSKFASSK